jgi:hypothetical protein
VGILSQQNNAKDLPMQYAPNLSICSLQMPVATAINPLLNNGKTEIAAGETALFYTQDYLEMRLTWPQDQKPKLIEDIDVGGVPSCPASNPGDQIRAEAAAAGITPTDTPEVQSKKK